MNFDFVITHLQGQIAYLHDADNLDPEERDLRIAEITRAIRVLGAIGIPTSYFHTSAAEQAVVDHARWRGRRAIVYCAFINNGQPELIERNFVLPATVLITDIPLSDKNIFKFAHAGENLVSANYPATLVETHPEINSSNEQLVLVPGPTYYENKPTDWGDFYTPPHGPS